MIEAIYELTRAKMKETEIDGVPRTKNQVWAIFGHPPVY